jgi:hypothetical protein
MKNYCCFCKNEDTRLCLLYCDSTNQDQYKFNLLKWFKTQLIYSWQDIRLCWNLLYNKIRVWWILNYDKKWWKH